MTLLDRLRKLPAAHIDFRFLSGFDAASGMARLAIKGQNRALTLPNCLP